MNLRCSVWAMVMLATGAVMAAAPARADARQDVMAGAQRCAGIADDRTWLDCFYGSAQPMRARLGLPAAPANQQRLVPPQMGGAPLYNAPAYAAPAYTAPAYAAPSYVAPTYAAPTYAAPTYVPAAPVYGAPTYASPTYSPGAPVYTPAAPIYAAPTPTYLAPQAPANAAAAPAPAGGPPPLPKRRDSGFFGTVFGSGKPVISNVRMTSWTTNANGKFVVTLADGEIWEQEPGDDGHPSWRNPASRHVVNVYEGALGTYNLSVSDDSQIYKVHRVN